MPYNNSKSDSQGRGERRRDLLTPQEKELNYIIDKLSSISETYLVAANDELDNRDNKKAPNQLLSQLVTLYKFLKPKITNSELKTEIKYMNESGETVTESINKFYELIYLCDELERYILTKQLDSKNIFLKSTPTITDAFRIYELLREFIEDSCILNSANRVPGINDR